MNRHARRQAAALRRKRHTEFVEAYVRHLPEVPVDAPYEPGRFCTPYFFTTTTVRSTRAAISRTAAAISSCAASLSRVGHDSRHPQRRPRMSARIAAARFILAEC